MKKFLTVLGGIVVGLAAIFATVYAVLHFLKKDEEACEDCCYIDDDECDCEDCCCGDEECDCCDCECEEEAEEACECCCEEAAEEEVEG